MSDENASVTTESAFASAFTICGGSASVGRPRDDARDAVAHVVRGGVDVAVHVELDADLRALVLAVGLDLEDAFDAGDGVLDDLRDLGLDDRGGRAAIAPS